MITKSEFLAAQSCPKRLWLTYHRPLERAAPSGAAQMRMRSGKVVGQLATRRFSGGISVPFWDLDIQDAALRTDILMQQNPPAIFEATFISGELLARVDVLKQEGDGWRIIEVKATSKYKKPDHLPDVAFQACILKQLGVPVVGYSVMHLNSEYIWEGGDYDVDSLFTEVDITEDVLKIVDTIPLEAASLLGLASLSDYPPVDGEPPYVDPVIFGECKTCDFRKHCEARVPADHPYYLGLHHSKLKKLLAAGIRSISDVPEDTQMNDKERLRFEAFKTGRPAIDPTLADRLAEIQYPAYMLDFETLRPDLPLFPGQSPFQLLPFQWSCHTLFAPPTKETNDPNLDHEDFIHEHPSDPREAFVRSLLNLLEEGGSIVHYHGYEKDVIKALVKAGIRDADKLLAMFDRFVDLRTILEDCYAHAGFLGKTSIKNVLPIIAPAFSYKDLNIQNGDQAQIEYLRTLTNEVTGDEREVLFEDLRSYCKLDTWAMVEILKALLSVA